LFDSLKNSPVLGLTSIELESIARETGFLKRKSKVDPSVFFDLLMYDISSGRSKSLNQLAIEGQSEHSIGITKQGLDKRFNDSTIRFLKRLIEKQLSMETSQQIEAGWLSSFNRVTIKDGTRFDLQDDYKEHLRGSGGCASGAGACLQFEFDLKSGRIVDLNLTPANRPDVKDALETLDDVSKGDLVIRDLGYYAFQSFLSIIDKDAFFLSRLRPRTIVFEMKNQNLQRLDFKALYNRMKRNGQSSIYKNVFIGDEGKIPIRLAIELMPENVYEQRIQRLKKYNIKKGRQISEAYKLMARFNLFITNVPKETLPDEVVSTLYIIRWQIELIFKIWKSVIGIHHSHKMKYIRWLSLLHFKLLIMIINWNIIMTQRNHLYNREGKLISLNKCFKTLFDNNHRLREAIKLGIRGIAKFTTWVENILVRNHWLEKKKNTKGLEEILYLIFCKSKEYAYLY
jgi:hypothetical protein